MGPPNLSHETKFSGVNADREMLIFPVQLTTSRISNLTRLIHNLAICVTIHWYNRQVLVLLIICIYISSMYGHHCPSQAHVADSRRHIDHHPQTTKKHTAHWRETASVHARA